MTSAARSRVAFLSACLLLAPLAQSPAQAPFQVPAYTGYVNDFAGVLTPDTRASLTSLAERINAATRGDLVIVTIADIGDRAASDVALDIGRQWKVGANAAIGDRARNAGVVILLVPKETSSTNRGSCRIEVGQGSEGFITDGTSGTICREATPFFAQRDYSRGVELVAARVAQLYAREFNVSLDGIAVPQPSTEPSGGRGSGGGNAVLILMVVVFILASSLGKRGRGGRNGCLNMLPFLLAASGSNHGRGGWGGSGGGFGGGGGGFGGFGGGGGFSGGGGGSDW